MTNEALKEQGAREFMDYLTMYYRRGHDKSNAQMVGIFVSDIPKELGFYRARLERDQTKRFWAYISNYVAKKKVDWYEDFTKQGAKLLGYEECEDCEKKIIDFVKK